MVDCDGWAEKCCPHRVCSTPTSAPKGSNLETSSVCPSFAVYDGVYHTPLGRFFHVRCLHSSNRAGAKKQSSALGTFRREHSEEDVRIVWCWHVLFLVVEESSQTVLERDLVRCLVPKLCQKIRLYGNL